MKSAAHRFSATAAFPVALGLLLPATAALADATLQFGSLSVPNAQTPVNADPFKVIPTQTNQYYSGSLSGVTVTATACLWTAVDSGAECSALVWPKASDLAIIIRKPAPAPAPPGFYDVVLQIGGATRLPNAGTSFPWVNAPSQHAEAAGTCNTQLGCAGGNPGSFSQCTGTNSGGKTNYVDASFSAGSGGWASAIPMGTDTEVVLVWLPEASTNTQNPPSNAWTDPNNNGSPAIFCDISVEFEGVTEGTAPPCANPTYRSSSNCADPCECSTANSPTDCDLPVNAVHPVEIRFVNRSGIDASQVKLLPYSCAKSFATTSNPGVLYSDAECTQLLWRDGLFSALGARSEAINGCGHGPGWTGQDPCGTVFTGTGPTVPMRTLRMSDLHDNGDGTYSLWTNHFPEAIWYIGLPQRQPDGSWSTVPEVPFFVMWDSTTQYGTSDVIEIAGLSYTWRAFNSATSVNYFAPPSPAAGRNSAPWAVVSAGDCEQGGVQDACAIDSYGVDWQQLEITMDGSPADIADITYIDFANVPLRLESYYATGDSYVEATGYAAVADATQTSHPAFGALVQQLTQQFPANLYLTCADGDAYALQSSGPNQTDSTCGNSPFIPVTYPAHSSGAACNTERGTINDFRAVFERMLTHTHTFPGHSIAGSGWIRDWVGSPTSPSKFDYDFVLVMSKDTATAGQVSYTATLKGIVKVWNGNTGKLVMTSDPLALVLGTDTYYANPATKPNLDLTRSIYLAPTPGNMPVTLALPSGCSSQSLATLSLFGAGDTQAGSDPRLSQAWVAVMNQIDSTIGTASANWFGAIANQNVTALIGRLMGDACAGFALGFLASEQANPIIPVGGLASWPSYGSTYPATDTTQLDLCNYAGAAGEPFWKTPSGSWWGGALFKPNALDGSTSYWSSECASTIFIEHYGDVAPPVDGNFMCSGWGQLMYQNTQGGYSHPIEDRMNGYKAGINGYQFAGQPITRLKVTFWRGISSTGSGGGGGGGGGDCPADLNHDGQVSAYDLAVLLAGWTGESPCSDCAADLNHDGKVNGDDLTVMLAAWGPCP